MPDVNTNLVLDRLRYKNKYRPSGNDNVEDGNIRDTFLAIYRHNRVFYNAQYHVYAMKKTFVRNVTSKIIE